jgi:HEAT repeat protein
VYALEAAARDAAAETVPALTESLKDSDGVVRQIAARSLFGIGPSARTAMPALIASMRDAKSEVRLYSALALGNTGAGCASAIDALAHAINDDDDVGIVAVRSLGMLGPFAASSLPKLRTILEEADPQSQLRFEAEKSIGAILGLPR